MESEREWALKIGKELAEEAHCRYCAVPDFNKCAKDIEFNATWIAAELLRAKADGISFGATSVYRGVAKAPDAVAAEIRKIADELDGRKK